MQEMTMEEVGVVVGAVAQYNGLKEFLDKIYRDQPSLYPSSGDLL